MTMMEKDNTSESDRRYSPSITFSKMFLKHEPGQKGGEKTLQVQKKKFHALTQNIFGFYTIMLLRIG
jgi:hypothetical protein